MNIHNDFKNDFEITNHFIRFYHNVHLLNFMNNYVNNVKIEHIIKDTNNGNHYEVFYKAPKLFESIDYRSNKELDYSLFNEQIIELKEYDLNLDSEIFTNKVIEFNQSFIENFISVKGFFFNKIFYAYEFTQLEDKEEDE